MFPCMAQAQQYVFGTTPALHVDGNVLKDPSGNTVVLHGVMDTPSPYFNSYRWGEWWGGFTDEAVTRCKDYFDKITTAITSPEKGTYCNLFRLHLDPCWTNDPNKTATGSGQEDDISRFSADRLRTYFNSLYLPIALNALSKGLYVIIRPPGVFPQRVNVGGEYNNYLMTVWNIVSSNETLKQYSGQISLELGNEPVTVLNAYGQSDSNALHDFFQPIVNKIRQNGFNGILWIPGTGWQSNYQDYVSHPIQDSNFGYAVHNYVGWYNGNNSTPISQLNNYINQFHTQVPVIDTNPIVITEVDWSPENSSAGHYDEHGNWVTGNYGTWATGTTSMWGALYKGLLDHYGTISMTLSGTDTYIDVSAYLSNGTVQPAYQTAMGGNAWEACSGACFQWYKEWALAQMSSDIPNTYQLGDNIVNYAPTVWAGQTGEYGGLGHTAYERYNSGSIGQGDVLTQTLTGVKSGKYNVTLELAGSYTPGRGFTCPTGTESSLAFANNEYRTLEVFEREWVSSVQPLTITATVSDGTLKYGIYNFASGGNWYVANVTGITYVSANTDNTFAISTSAQHGTVTPSSSNAAAGTTVTLSAIPASGFQLDSYTVTTCTGENVSLDGNSFVMPSADVTVTASFSLSYEVGDDIIAIAPTEWAGQTDTYSGLGHTAYERYESGSISQGDVLTQTISGLKNGLYAVTLELAASYTSGRGFECPTGDGLSVAFANGTQESLEVVERGWVSSVSPVTLYATVSDGTLKYGIRNLTNGGNWYVANVTGIEYISASTSNSFSISTSAQHGTITPSVSIASAGTTVTLSITPDTDYELESIAVTTVTGEIVSLSGNSFVMPAADVTVTATFSSTSSPSRTYDLTVSSAGVATLYLPYDASVPDVDFFVVASVKEVSGTTAYLKEIRGGVIPAYTGVMVFANPGTYTLSESSVSASESVESLLHGVVENTSVQTLVQREGKSIYVLSRGVQEYVGFKVAGGTVKTIGAYKAYLPVENSGEALAKSISIFFGGDDTTDIEVLKNYILSDTVEICDLTGRKVTYPKKGIYIVDGKKVLIK